MRTDGPGPAAPERSLVLATGNPGKVRELRAMLEPLGLALLLPEEVGAESGAEENGGTFFANALIKAEAIARHTLLPVLSDDSGLEVEALHGAPGVDTAYYAGPKATAAENRNKLLAALAAAGARDPKARKARFRCILCYRVTGAEPLYFEGICEGSIAPADRGGKGFGYDPLFVPEGFEKTFAEMSEAEKAGLSHRGRAVQAFRDHLLAAGRGNDPGISP